MNFNLLNVLNMTLVASVLSTCMRTFLVFFFIYMYSFRVNDTSVNGQLYNLTSCGLIRRSLRVMRICPKDWFCEVSVWFHIQIQTSITVFGYFTVLHLVLIFLFANMHLLITKYSIPPLNKCMTFLAHGLSVFFIRKIRARVRTHKNRVD